MAAISIVDVTKRYEKHGIIAGLNLEIADREFVVLVGPSGCGKSTLLRLIAGLEEVSSGVIALDGRPIQNIPPRLRDIAMVFQNYALYPHMTVAKNMGLALELRGMGKAEVARKVGEVAVLLGLSSQLDKKPKQLSGGQRQRVAMGRAMVRQPAAFLFDEPLSNLDAELRGRMRAEIKKLHPRLKSTMVYVTHDQMEAMTLADRMVVLRGGAIEQVGTPMQVFAEPANEFVAGFIGSPRMNFLAARVQSQELVLSETPASMRTVGWQVSLGQALRLGVRPEHFTLGIQPHASLVLQGTVAVVEPLGSEVLLEVACGAATVLCKIRLSGAMPQPGAQVSMSCMEQDVHVFDGATGVRCARAA